LVGEEIHKKNGYVERRWLRMGSR